MPRAKIQGPIVRVVRDGIYQCVDPAHERDYNGLCIVAGCDRSVDWWEAHHLPRCTRCRKRFAALIAWHAKSGFPVPSTCPRCRREAVRPRRKAPSIRDSQWRAILVRFGHRCAYCNVTGTLTKDHDIPVARGGALDPSNIVPACALCNSRKGDKTGDEFRAWLRMMIRRGHLVSQRA